MSVLTAAQFTEEQRRQLASKGVAMEDGSFPIRNRSDLRNAVRALGRAKDRGKAKAHIVERARALGAEDVLPEEWGITAAGQPSAEQQKIAKVMHEFKRGKLKSNGKVVTDRKQALAIAMSEARGLAAAADWEEESEVQEVEEVEEVEVEEAEDTASALTAAAAGLAPLIPPKTWFEDPKLDGPTPITVTADGRVFGHAALWGTCHTGMPGVCRTPPRSSSDYAYFHLGEIDTDGGAVPVGRVTMNTGHAPLTASRESTVRHYDDTGTGAAHVRAGEDEHGIWLAGSLAPDLPAEQARRLRGAAVSGDWRSINGKLELMGMLAVNVPGFPVPRAMAAALLVEDEPQTMSLVAAGVYCSKDEEDRKLRALTARATGGLDGLYEAAMGGSKVARRMGVTAAAWDESKHPRGGKGTHEGGKFVLKGAPTAENIRKGVEVTDAGDKSFHEEAARMRQLELDDLVKWHGEMKASNPKYESFKALFGMTEKKYAAMPEEGKDLHRAAIKARQDSDGTYKEKLGAWDAYRKKYLAG